MAVVVLFLAADLNFIETAKILAIFPFQSRSHLIMGSALMKELLKRGHEITMISHHPEKEKIANYTDIYVKTTMMDVLGDQGKRTLCHTHEISWPTLCKQNIEQDI